MTRTANSTIKGFLYQFNKSIIAIASSDDNQVTTIEGLIEDIDLENPLGEISAIQCKYHESVENFTDSLIYKPLLQMAETYSKDPSAKVKFSIFIHVPNHALGEESIELKTLDSAFLTDNANLKKIVVRIGTINRLDFLKKVTLSFGPSLEALEIEAKKLIGKLNIPNSDIDCILYPNSITKISKMASLKEESERQITKLQLITHLAKMNSIAITKWTLALKNKKEILAAYKKQLNFGLSQNSRERFFYISANDIEDFQDDIVVFISDFLAKYHTKPSHLKTPLFAIDCNFLEINDLAHRLYKKGIRATTGLIGAFFESSELFRDPITTIVKSKIEKREFDVRLLAYKDAPMALGFRKSDDFFFIADLIPTGIDFTDSNIYQAGINTFAELNYVMGLRDSYE
jgi:hypothetical protein